METTLGWHASMRRVKATLTDVRGRSEATRAAVHSPCHFHISDCGLVIGGKRRGKLRIQVHEGVLPEASFVQIDAVRPQRARVREEVLRTKRSLRVDGTHVHEFMSIAERDPGAADKGPVQRESQVWTSPQRPGRCAINQPSSAI